MQNTEFASQVMKDHMDSAASGSCPILQSGMRPQSYKCDHHEAEETITKECT